MPQVICEKHVRYVDPLAHTQVYLVYDNDNKINQCKKKLGTVYLDDDTFPQGFSADEEENTQGTHFDSASQMILDTKIAEKGSSTNAPITLLT